MPQDQIVSPAEWCKALSALSVCLERSPPSPPPQQTSSSQTITMPSESCDDHCRATCRGHQPPVQLLTTWSHSAALFSSTARIVCRCRVEARSRTTRSRASVAKPAPRVSPGCRRQRRRSRWPDGALLLASVGHSRAWTLGRSYCPASVFRDKSRIRCYICGSVMLIC